MKISLVNSSDMGGGAEKIALLLHANYLRNNYASRLHVYEKQTDTADIFELPIPPAIRNPREVFRHYNGNIPLFLKQVLYSIRNRINFEQGLENIALHNKKQIVELLCNDADILHTHNLHGRYFDLSILSSVSSRIPVVMTLHDEWAYTGHCAYTLGCDRWLLGCGQCPHLNVYPSIKRDGSHANWLSKMDIYSNSSLFIVTPSQWLMDRANRSMLHATKAHVIPNGINLNIFQSGNKFEQRHNLGLETDAVYLLYIANRGANNLFRDYKTVFECLKKIQSALYGKKVNLLLVGGEEKSELDFAGIKILKIPYVKEEKKLARYYQAADTLLYATHADNYPTIILEAMASGLVVIATDVGGIREQVQEGQSGFLIPENDSSAMAKKLAILINDNDLLQKMGDYAADYAKIHFDANLMSKNYLDWYREIISETSRK